MSGSDAAASPVAAQTLTRGPIFRQLIQMAIPIAIGLIFQNLYHLIDLYFVAQLGEDAVAGVSAAGNVTFMVLAATQALSVGTVALVAQAIGRQDNADAHQVFNQSLGVSFVLCLLTLVLGYALASPYMQQLAASDTTLQAGNCYLYWFLPCLALQFPMVAVAAALRGCGVVKPAMLIQLLTVLINAVLAPMLIVGWGTGVAFGVAGAGAASSLSMLVGVLLLIAIFRRMALPIRVDLGACLPRSEVLKRLLKIGAPAGGEFLLIFIYMALIYWLIKPFGEPAQAGFGIAMRIMNAIFLPAMAVAFALSAVAGQNVGAGLAQRVRDCFRIAAITSSVLMVLLTAICQWQADALLALFTHEPAVLAVGTVFLHIVSWNFIANGVVFCCSSMFQALGHTWPSLMSSGSRLLTFALPAVWLSTRDGFALRQIWTLSVATVAAQAGLSLWLLAREMRRRLPLVG